MDRQLRRTGGRSSYMHNNPGGSSQPASSKNQPVPSPPFFGRNLQSGPPSLRIRRSPRLHCNCYKETAKHSISSSPRVRANDDNKCPKAADSSNKSSSLKDAAMIEEDPKETTARNNTVINEGAQVDTDYAQINGIENNHKRPTTGLPSLLKQNSNSNSNSLDGGSMYQGVSRYPRHYEAHLPNIDHANDKGKTIDLGGYDKQKEAAKAYDLGDLRMLGPSKPINFPLIDYEKELEAVKTSVMKSKHLPRFKRKGLSSAREPISRFRGVSRNSDFKKWQARLGKTKAEKSIYLGTFFTEEEAARAYDIATIRLKGPGAVTNFELNTYDVPGICLSRTIPIGAGASRWIKKTSAEDVALWRARINPGKTSGPDRRPQKKAASTGSSSQPPLPGTGSSSQPPLPGLSPLEEIFITRADRPGVDAGADLPKIHLDHAPVWVRNPSFSFLKDAEVPPSQIDLDSFSYGPYAPMGGASLAENDNIMSQELPSYAPQDAKPFLPGPLGTLAANPDGQSSKFPVSYRIEGPVEDINSQDQPELMSVPVRSNGISVTEYLSELFPDGKLPIPKVDWDEMLPEKGSDGTPVNGTGTNLNPFENKTSTHLVQNPSSSTAGFFGNPSPLEEPKPATMYGSLSQDGNSTVNVNTSNAGGGAGGSQTHPLNGIGGLFPGMADEAFDFGAAGWLNMFVDMDNQGNNGGGHGSNGF